jgi:hypothetical protein
MLSKVEARTMQGDILALTLQDPSEGIILEEVEGLDPVNATLVSSDYLRIPGASYRSSHREKRDLVFKFDLESDDLNYTVQDIRRRLYKFFMPQSQVKLRFYDSSETSVDILGRVESFETPLFSQEPAVSIGVQCYDPDFIDTTLITETGSTTFTALETPFDYEGSVSSGINFKLLVNRSISEFTIYQRAPDGSFRSQEFASPMVSGDVLEISNVPGAKKVTLTSAGSSRSLLYAISPRSSWISLEPGTNFLRVYAEGAAVPYVITYNNRYGGL